MSAKKYLIVKGCAGMGNRLFTISAAIEYCKKNNRTLFVDWSDGLFAPKGINCFNDFFEIKDLKTISDWSEIQNIHALSFNSSVWKNDPTAGVYDLFEVVYHPFFSKLPKRLLPKGRLRMLLGYWRKKNASVENSKIGFLNFVLGIFNKDNFPFGGEMDDHIKEDVLFYADYVPSYSEETFLRHIGLQRKLEQKINGQAAIWGLDTNSIGVNVRSTDKKPFNSIDVLFNKIAALKLREPKIFLATDNKKVQGIFKERFPGLLFYERFLPDITSGGLHLWSLYQNKPEFATQILDDSINELWLLSKCEYLFYQSNSSFSVLAKMLHVDKSKAFDWDKV